MSSPQQEEYLRRQAEESQRRQQRTVQRRRENPAEAAQHWRRWAKYGVFTALALVAVYSSWVYLWPLIFPQVFPPEPMEQLTIDEVVAEFRDTPQAAEKKYTNKRITVEGNLRVEAAKKGTANTGRIYFELPGEKGENVKVYCEFFDIDDAGSIDPGDGVRISGLIQRAGPRDIKIVGAARE